jgi:hypothetical protein
MSPENLLGIVVLVIENSRAGGMELIVYQQADGKAD